VREAEQALLDKAGDGAQAVDFDDYADAAATAAPRRRHRRDRGRGPILTGKDAGSNPFTGGASIYSDDLAEAILKAAKADSVKAIVLRLNSPGGSDTASEQILDAIRVAKSKGKPVVISDEHLLRLGRLLDLVGGLAIVAQPTDPDRLRSASTVGKFALGPRAGEVRRRRARGASAASTPARSAWAAVHRRPARRRSRWMDRIYATSRPCRPGRTAEPVAEIAKGRVWTGAQAKDIGLWTRWRLLPGRLAKDLAWP
jgi:protease-4